MLSLLGALMGFLTSALPELLELLQDRRDKKHELEMLTKQAEIARERDVELARIEAQSIRFQSDAEYDIKLASALNAQSKILNERDKPTGDKFLDRLRGAVRPVITYWWMLLYSGVKVAILIHVFTTPDIEFMKAMSLVWSEEDAAVFASIIAFWFGQKMMQKRYERSGVITK